METTRPSATLAHVPNQPKTPVRNFRIDDELYRAAQAKAAERGETLTEAIRQLLEWYVKHK
jgi:predicted HicB family RNase H-like nuclease